MLGNWFKRHIKTRRAVPIRIMIFVGAIMLPTIILGYLAIRTAETERVAVWEKLKESYTSLANIVSDQLDNMLSSAENDFRDSVSALPSHDKDSLQRLSDQLEGKHGVIHQVFFLNASGEMVFPEDPRKAREQGSREARGRERDIFESYLAAGERQEFKHKNPQRAIYEYQRILGDMKEPVYKAIALNGIARCYAKLGLNQEAIDHYSKIIDEYVDVTDGWIDIAAIAYLQAASIYRKMDDVDSAVEMLMALYSNLSDNRWDLDAEEISYFADRARRQLLVTRDASRVTGFAEIDANVVRLVKLHRFLKNYDRLVSDEMAQVVNPGAGDPGLVLHLLRYTDAGPYLVSYIPNPAVETDAMARGSLMSQATTVAPDREKLNDIALAGFEVDLDYLASQGFEEVLSGLTIKDDVILAILNEDNEILDLGAPKSKIKNQKSKILLTTVTSSSLPFWKVGVYLKEPESLERLSKRKAGLRIFVIVGLILAIAFGIYLTLREARREAELARLRSDFVANVSHELRTPLSSIQIFSETLKQNKITNRDKQEQYLDTISSESDRLARLVDNVLDFSRLERRIKEFKFRPVNVGEVVTSAVEAYRFYAEQRGATIRLNMAQDLPEIEADSEAISQMVINLVDNAVKYSDVGSLSARNSEDGGEITIHVFRRGNNIVIQVADKGVGMDEEDMKKIFDKFYRGKNVANLGTGGTGLGLTLAKAVAEAHGGDILVRSKRGVGSRFSVILPLSREKEG
jgi:signal transduction histidine kinase/tetratricopeptide (TPR) repeat protein